LTYLIAYHALLSLDIIRSIWFFHDKELSIFNPRNLVFLVSLISLLSQLIFVLTHLCLVFHYWNSSHGRVIYILLCKIIAISDVYAVCGPPEFTCCHVVHRVSHCYRHWHAGSLSKSDVNFRKQFLTTIQWQVNTTLLHYILY
jgi:hypothetical protein